MREMNIRGRSDCPYMDAAKLAVEAPSSPERRFSLPLTALRVSPPRTSQSVWTRDHDYTEIDGEVRHAVCSKTEHPEYDKETRHDKDIAVLHLCQPLMFSDGKFFKY